MLTAKTVTVYDVTSKYYTGFFNLDIVDDVSDFDVAMTDDSTSTIDDTNCLKPMAFNDRVSQLLVSPFAIQTLAPV